MALITVKTVVRLSLLGVALVLAGCVSMEFDRMVGTTFPTAQNAGGQSVDIESIFTDAGFLVTVEEDDTNIPLLNIPQDDCISDAELDALETTHRSSPLFPSMNRHYLYAVVVDHYGEVMDACVPNWVLGKMWAHHTRQALALFYKHSTIQAGSPEYLRTTVHEMGHAFNLHHEDGDGSTTIMTQTGDLADNWGFTFSNDSLEHLQDHPNKCKRPGAVGGAPFTWVISDHLNWHNTDQFTSFNCN